jgi:lipopolysaccharide assembly protein A
LHQLFKERADPVIWPNAKLAVISPIARCGAARDNCRAAMKPRAVTPMNVPPNNAADKQMPGMVIHSTLAATLVFGMQNFEAATASFLGFTVRAPLAVLTAIVYLLGALSGSSVFALIRRSVHASRASRPTIR